MMDGLPPLGTKTTRSDSQSVINASRRRVETGQQDLVANHMPPIQAPHLKKNVDEIQGGIEIIKAEVEEARLIVTCLKQSIGEGRNLSSDEYDAILSQYGDRINIGYVRNFTTLSPNFTQEKAETKLQHAEMKLQHAEMKLQHAEMKLKDAKAELKDAEVKLNYNETFGEESDIDSVLAQSKYLSLILLDDSTSEDMVGFVGFTKKALLANAKPLDLGHKNTPENMQHTNAIVLRSASGVGKTYATLAMTYFLFKDPTFKYFPIAVYMGLNTICLLTGKEKRRLEKGGEAGLEHVLLRRLLIQLNYLASPDVKIDGSLWDTTTGVQKMPVPANGWYGCSLHFNSNEDYVVLRLKLASLLATIAEKAGKPIVLFPIVDEGQILDGICPKLPMLNGHEDQGARWALRLLRKLQLPSTDKLAASCKVLGMMTGIDPTVLESNVTFGNNISYQEVLHSTEGFKKIAKEMFAKRKYDDSQVARVAAAYYPIVRDLQRLAAGRDPHPCSVGDLPAETTVLLLLASGEGCPIVAKWSPRIPALFADGSTSVYTPILGIRHVAAVAQSLGALPCNVKFEDFALSPDYKEFEAVTSFCLTALLVLNNYGVKVPSRIKAFDGMCTTLEKWLNVGVKVNVKTPTIFPGDPMRAHFPSSKHGSHATAFAVNGVHTPRLHPAFILDGLSEVGDTVLMNCGGNAPVDMIYVTLTEKGDGTSRRTLQIRLCDAKLVTSPKNRVDGLDAMPKRFEMVKEYLEYHLGEMNYKPEFSDDAVITTATGDIMPKNMIAFSPATCKFAPITNWWFACAPKGGNATS